MAHIAVHLQRTPHGLHPASAVALCWARDIGSTRGATVTGLCRGDAGSADASITAAAARFGADVLLFGGPSGLRNLCERLNPVHVMVPYTPQGLAAAEALDAGAAVPRWIDSRSPPYATADAVTAVVAGVKPWHRFELELDPEYEGDVDAVALPAFVEKSEDGTDAPAPPVFDLGPAPLSYVGPDRLDSMVATALEGLGATRSSWEEAAHRTGGTTLVLLEPAATLPETLHERKDGGRVVALPGQQSAEPSADVPAPWQHADWVLPGRWTDVIASLREGPWTAAPA